ncbi:MAG: aspartate/tyrosine/aromatic aminotransferase [Burkholderiaceae bacterium]|nr:aspartate/tyrosine/aromatic aminotransferase [Burkholderiaceae bacterium]
MFSTVPAYPGDPILTLNEQFQADPRQEKVNLSIGVFLDDQGRIPVMKAVAQASAQLRADAPHPYLPMEGDAAYRAQVQRLLFGQALDTIGAQRLATAQTLGGSGALKVAADFLKRYFPDSPVLVSAPTWDNHHAIFEGAGFTVGRYPYFDPATRGLDFDGMMAALKSAASGTLVLLHACCHNPTGVDPSAEQWQQVRDVVVERSLVPFFDIAYQGFGAGLDEDAYALRLFAEAGIPMLVASSFSKNFSLYGERCGALTIVCPNAEQAEHVLGQLKATVRRNYSSPPAFGAKLIAAILADDALRTLWQDEVAGMRHRIAAVRGHLHAALKHRQPDVDYDYIVDQTGMFTYTGLSAEAVGQMRDRDGVYLVNSGRMCLAALSIQNVDRVADAMVALTSVVQPR